MFNFNRKEKIYPEFDFLNGYDKKNSYFIRVAEWSWLDKEKIIVMDPHGPRILTLDPWPQYVFLAANGQITVTEYVYYMADKYKTEIPKLLDQTIINEMNSLVQYQIIKFVEQKQRPESRFELPRRDIK